MITDTQKKALINDFRDFADDVGGWAQNYWHRVTGQQQKELAQRFLEWSQQNLPDHELQTWINNLSDEGLVVLTEMLVRFCNDFDFDLAWLVDGRLVDYPDLTQAFPQVVAHYCAACKLALSHHETIKKFRRLDYYHQDPKKNP